jgi:hypothetical protein
MGVIGLTPNIAFISLPTGLLCQIILAELVNTSYIPYRIITANIKVNKFIQVHPKKSHTNRRGSSVCARDD